MIDISNMMCQTPVSSLSLLDCEGEGEGALGGGRQMTESDPRDPVLPSSMRAMISLRKCRRDRQ